MLAILHPVVHDVFFLRVILQHKRDVPCWGTEVVGTARFEQRGLFPALTIFAHHCGVLLSSRREYFKTCELN